MFSSIGGGHPVMVKWPEEELDFVTHSKLSDPSEGLNSYSSPYGVMDMVYPSSQIRMDDFIPEFSFIDVQAPHLLRLCDGLTINEVNLFLIRRGAPEKISLDFVDMVSDMDR
ncbi:hypothetical protein HAX54_030383 [Datura stramonium]|uniref:Uncharacterized protein n=1 Tax=Datura stramonium TaxID=4076 RepID=A0ABS8VAN1_DATST|nr:hypothetical protein [Datura stramonium]